MRHPTFLLIAALVATVAHAQSLPDLFRQGQEQFRNGEYQASETTFQRLDAESRKPGFENDRARLEPVLIFFGGANAAMLGRAAEATDRFLDYLVFVPRATLDERAFPRQVVAAFREARDEYEELNRRAASGDLASVWQAFSPVGTVAAGPDWAESAVRYLMTEDEKTGWSAATTPEAREQFVEDFWSRRDPTPGDDDNALRDEIESRILFADRAFSTADVPGRNSDQGLVFALLGPPSFVRGGSIGDADSMEVLRTQRQGTNLGAGHQTRGNDRNLEAEGNQGRRESWYYRGDRKPKNVPFTEVRFDFITRAGYGVGVLQKEANQLMVLGRVADSMRPRQ